MVTVAWLVYDNASNSALPPLDASLSPPMPLVHPDAYVPARADTRRSWRYKTFIRPAVAVPWLVHGVGWNDSLLPSWTERPWPELHFQHYRSNVVPGKASRECSTPRTRPRATATASTSWRGTCTEWSAAPGR